MPWNTQQIFCHPKQISLFCRKQQFPNFLISVYWPLRISNPRSCFLAKTNCYFGKILKNRYTFSVLKSVYLLKCVRVIFLFHKDSPERHQKNILKSKSSVWFFLMSWNFCSRNSTMWKGWRMRSLHWLRWPNVFLLWCF